MAVFQNFLAIFFIAICFIVFSANAKKKEYKPVKDELPHIACDVCRRAVSNLVDAVDDMRDHAPYKKIDEMQIAEIIDDICNPEEEIGYWIRKLDIVSVQKKGDTFLNMEEPGGIFLNIYRLILESPHIMCRTWIGISKCETECKTISASCVDLFEEEIDRDDLSALLWKNKNNKAQIKVCEWYYQLIISGNLTSFFCD